MFWSKRRYDTVVLALAEPTLFMDAKFKYTKKYFCTMLRAKRWARKYLFWNRCGMVCLYTRRRRGR